MEKNLKVYNKYNREINVLHFQGKNLEQFVNTSILVFELCKLDPLEDDLSVVTCWTHWDKCILGQQFRKNKLLLHNALPKDYDYSKPWDMRNKIKFYIDYLENNIDTNIVLILDAYDVLLSSTKNIVKKFKSQPYKIIFNSTVNNYPNVKIDIIENRLQHDRFSPFFNAGCCIGYKDDLIKFYKECYELINIDNEFNSEQYILRHVFAKYSNDKNQKFIWIDFYRDIFHSMGYMLSNYNADTLEIKIDDNLLIPQNKRDTEQIENY